MDATSQILYLINNEDEVIFANNEWLEFVSDKDGDDITPENQPRQSLWDLINDNTTEDFYRMLLKQVRAGYSVKFKVRCGAPRRQTLMRMTVSLQQNGDVQFGARAVWTDELRPQNFLNGSISHMDEVIIICSWCNKIKVDEGDWQEIEEFQKNLGLFDLEILPQPSHGMCDDCYKVVSEKFQK
ncbi:MAG: hypothetical protein ABWZ66_12570 [Pyrinomonadaceae bacterium]